MPYFSTGLAKTKSDFIVKSVETGLRWRTLVVAVISVDAYHFWLSQTWPVITLRIQEYKFSDYTVLPDCKKTKPGRSKQEVSPSAGKNAEIIWVPCHAWKCVLTAISGGVDISEIPRCHLLQQMSSQWVTKITSTIGISWTQSLPFCFNLFYQKDVNQITLNYTTL